MFILVKEFRIALSSVRIRLIPNLFKDMFKSLKFEIIFMGNWEEARADRLKDIRFALYIFVIIGIIFAIIFVFLFPSIFLSSNIIYISLILLFAIFSIYVLRYFIRKFER